MGHLDKVCDLICGQIELPKTLAIENRRLGALHRILQCLALVWVIFNVINLRPWLQGTVPMANGFERWAEAGDAVSMEDSTVQHCTQTSSYQYQWSATWVYSPSTCLKLPRGEDFVKSAESLFFTTFVQDAHTERHVGNCAGITCTGVATSVTYNNVQMCECTNTEHFFSQNAELNTLHINHGYKVNMDATGSIVQSSTSQATKVLTQSGNYADKESPGTILSIIEDYKGDPCTVGGRSEFTQAVDSSINGPLKDWLACGGLDLDLAKSSTGITVSGNPAEDPPRFRITGAELLLSMTFYNAAAPGHPGKDKHNGVVCKIRVSTSPQWNGNTDIAYTKVPSASDYRTGPSNYRYRYQYGVSVKMQAQGTFMYFDYATLVTAFVTQLVILSVPAKIVAFIALNAVGLSSKIFKRAAKQVLTIDKMFHGFCARLLSSSKVFHLLAPTGVLTLSQIQDGLKDAFQDAVVSSVLDEKEVAHMARKVFASMDTKGTGTVTLGEFTNASTRNESIQSSEMIAYFDEQRKVSVLERVFSATKIRHTSEDKLNAVVPVQ